LKPHHFFASICDWCVKERFQLEEEKKSFFSEFQLKKKATFLANYLIFF